MRCPFHGVDRNPSASYNPTLQRFRCHQCGVAGDGYDLIQENDRCDFLTAKAKAAEICGGNFTFPEEPTGPQRSRLANRKKLQRSRLSSRKRRR